MTTITKAQALEALDDLDDYARMETGVDAHGPRETLRQFIEQASRTGLDPEMGFILEGANKGELAAYEFAVASHCVATLEILNGKNLDFGSCNEPWAGVRKRLVELVKSTK